MIMNILIEEIKKWNFSGLGSICGTGPPQRCIKFLCNIGGGSEKGLAIF